MIKRATNGNLNSLWTQIAWIFTLYYLLSSVHGSSDWLFLAKIKDIGPHVCEELKPGSRQKAICKEAPKMMRSVSDGAVRGILECQMQFKNDMWNCSVERGRSVFGKLLNAGTREVAFINAITSAGVMYSITKACSRGEYLNCSCDDKYSGHGKDSNGTFRWGGCSEDIQYGSYFAENFIDTSETGDPRSHMNLHNNIVGRKTLKKFMRRRCKCHGPTGSCELRTCWNELGEFRLTGNHLKKRYESAVKVEVGQNNGEMQPTKHVDKDLSKNDLVYLDKSPSFCFYNHETGSFGTAGRRCNDSSTGQDSCHVMCCGRKFDTKVVVRKEKCHCRFHWCCNVFCDECERTETISTCQEDGYEVISNKVPSKAKTKNRKGKKKKRKKGKGGKRKKSRIRRHLLVDEKVNWGQSLPDGR